MVECVDDGGEGGVDCLQVETKRRQKEKWVMGELAGDWLWVTGGRRPGWWKHVSVCELWWSWRRIRFVPQVLLFSYTLYRWTRSGQCWKRVLWKSMWRVRNGPRQDDKGSWQKYWAVGRGGPLMSLIYQWLHRYWRWMDQRGFLWRNLETNHLANWFSQRLDFWLKEKKQSLKKQKGWWPIIQPAAKESHLMGVHSQCLMVVCWVLTIVYLPVILCGVGHDSNGSLYWSPKVNNKNYKIHSVILAWNIEINILGFK